jgi:hypothetical protein
MQNKEYSSTADEKTYARGREHVLSHATESVALDVHECQAEIVRKAMQKAIDNVGNLPETFPN